MFVEDGIDDLRGALFVTGKLVAVHAVCVEVLAVADNGFQEVGWQTCGHHGNECVA